MGGLLAVPAHTPFFTPVRPMPGKTVGVAANAAKFGVWISAGNENDPGTAVYTMTSPGFTLMGLPTVTATVNTTGPFGELVGRVWDVLPDGTQRLVSRGIYRLTDNQQGQVTFQLHGNGYQFAAGDTVKLELLGRDSPYYRASNGAFTVQVSDVTVALPTT